MISVLKTLSAKLDAMTEATQQIFSIVDRVRNKLDQAGFEGETLEDQVDAIIAQLCEYRGEDHRDAAEN